MQSSEDAALRLGAVVKEIRLKQHLTQQQVADKCGVDIRYIGALERGERNNPTLEIIIGIASVLGLKPSELLRKAKL
jgi:transcriptional regulator with XRE-family HTH domain